MENTASCKCNVRHFQWLALALWIWPEVVNLINYCCKFFGGKFLTSAIFCGEKSCEPIEKGAFKFWNKFFKLWLIFFFGCSLLFAILGIILQ